MTTGDVLLARHALSPGERSSLYARARTGELHQLFRGCWIPQAHWALLSEEARHRLLCRAANVAVDDDLVFSHRSAAALWRLPLPGSWPARVHVLMPAVPRGRSTTVLVRHGRGPVDQSWRIDNLRVTSLEATVVDIAATEPYALGVVAADAALRRTEHPLDGVPPATVSREELLEEAARVPTNHGGVRARQVIEFADGAADRPGESLSRVSILRAGLSAPLLQVALRGASGREWTVDFFWPEFNVVGEFDGKAKYTDPAYLRGRTAEQAVYDEKLREDDLRAVPHGFTRWKWSTAISPELLGAQLRRAGVR